MGFIRYQKKQSGVYASYEERYREGGKGKSRYRSLGRVDGITPSQVTRKAADELYRQVLRDNVYTYGKSKPGERYAAADKARQAYQEYLKTGELPTSELEQYERDQKEHWEGESMRIQAKATAGHATFKAKEQYNAVRDEVAQGR